MNETAVLAAARILSAYDLGVAPECRDLWTIQLAVPARDAADLLLEPKHLARKIINGQLPLLAGHQGKPCLATREKWPQPGWSPG
jgi:hypothetical protein